VLYNAPSRYNWMLQYYLREQGLALSWVGTGRLIFSLNYSEDDFDAVLQRFVAAARQMQADGWWWQDEALSNRSIRRGLLRELMRELLSHAWRGPSGRSVRHAAGAAAPGGRA